MSFVEWVSVIALLVVCISGLLSGIMVFLRRRVEVGPYIAQGWRALLLGLVYLCGSVVALLALILAFTAA